MKIGEQRRTWHVEPIEVFQDEPVGEPDRDHEPAPQEPIRAPEPARGT